MREADRSNCVSGDSRRSRGPALPIVTALGLVLGPASLAPAQDAEDADDPEAAPVYEAEPIVVTATRTKKSAFEVPSLVNIVTAQDISESMYASLPDALRDVPGVMVQKTSHGQGSPFIRGFTGFRNLLLIDGIRLNNSVFREGPNQYWSTVDPDSIERLEVVKGPGSVLYGSDAIGGVVNAITKGPGPYGEGFQSGGRAAYRFGSAERSHSVRGEISATWDQTLGLYAGGTYRSFGDLESGGGRQPMTGYHELDGDFKLEYLVAPTTRLVVAHQIVDLDDVWRTHSTVFGRSFEGTTVGSDSQRILEQNRDLTYVQLHAEEVGAFFDAAHVSVSYQSQAETEDRVRSNGRRDLQGFDADTLGVSVQLETPSAIGNWTYGAEWYHDNVTSFRSEFNANGSAGTVHIQGPVADDATYDLVGIYVQDDIALADAVDLILGGRFTYARADAEQVEDPASGGQISVTEDYDTVVGSARVVWRLDEEDRWSLFGGVAQSFRAPNLSDLTRFDSARTNEIETPSPDLDPERYVSYEAGVKTQQGAFSAQAAYFFTDIDGMIIRQPTGMVIDGANEVTKRNGGSGFVQGVETEARWRFHPDWTASGSFAWQEGEVDGFPTSAPVLVREPVSRLLPLTGQIGLRWDAPKRDVWLAALVTIAGRQDKLSSGDRADTQRIPPGGTPGYAVLSLRGGWEIADGLTLTAAIENVTDENYRIHGSGVNEPGINVVLGLEYRF